MSVTGPMCCAPNWGDGMTLDLYSFTHPGGRPYNEDRCAAVQGPAPQNLPLLLLADGLGGHGHGDQAAEFIVQTLQRFWKTRAPDPADAAAALTDEIVAANKRLIEAQQKLHRTMRTTIVAAVPGPDTLACVHCGDSRLYLIQAGSIRQLTQDHSVTYKKYLAGQIGFRQINRDEDRSGLLRAVGDADRCQPEAWTLPVRLAPGDGLLLCSDGFWEYMQPEEILADCLKSDTAAEWGSWMLRRVMERLTPDTDNLTLMAGLCT